MKLFMMISLVVSSLAHGAPLRGTLTADGVIDGVNQFRCQLDAGKYSIAVNLNTDQKTVAFNLAGKLTSPENVDTTITGTYSLIELKEPQKPNLKIYEMNSYAYNFNLKFTDGTALPTLTLVWSGRELICQ